MQLKASAPGSMMLLGEYGVLCGQYALVCAINKRIEVTLTPRTDECIDICSASYHPAIYHTDVKRLCIEPPFQFVLGALKYYQRRLKQGCTIEIEADFSDQVGLGSSAAVTVATLAVLSSWLALAWSPLALVRVGQIIVRRVQGMGSGADIAASVYGGMIGYRAQPLVVKKYSTLYPLTVLYAGFKTPTATVVQQVQERFAAYPDVFRQLCHSIGQCGQAGLQLVCKEAWQLLGQLMTVQQGLLAALGVNMPLLQSMVDSLSLQTGILGAKISGSGLGDCVVGLGDSPDSYTYADSSTSVQRLSVCMTAQGVQCEKS